MLLAIALAAAVSGTSPAQPQQTSNQQPTTVAPAIVDAPRDTPKEGDKVICRNEPITGSRFIKRVCLKKFQWDQRDRDTEQYQQGIMDRSGTVGARGGMGAGPAGPF